MTDRALQKVIPAEELERINIQAFEYSSNRPAELESHIRQEGYIAGATSEYLRHQSQTTLRWIKAGERLPKNKNKGDIVHIRPITRGFDYYMFLKLIIDHDNEGTLKWNLWDGYHGWTLKITPELLDQIEWLEEIPADASKQPEDRETWRKMANFITEYGFNFQHGCWWTRHSKFPDDYDHSQLFDLFIEESKNSPSS